KERGAQQVVVLDHLRHLIEHRVLRRYARDSVVDTLRLLARTRERGGRNAEGRSRGERLQQTRPPHGARPRWRTCSAAHRLSSSDTTRSSSLRGTLQRQEISLHL